MYVVVLRLTDGARVAEHVAGHREWLRHGFDDGVFFLTGGIPQAGGGVILAAGQPHDQLAARMAADPFVANGVATPEIIEIEPTMNDPRLAFLAG